MATNGTVTFAIGGSESQYYDITFAIADNFSEERRSRWLYFLWCWFSSSDYDSSLI